MLALIYVAGGIQSREELSSQGQQVEQGEKHE
jgi:hypothetical protein